MAKNRLPHCKYKVKCELRINGKCSVRRPYDSDGNCKLNVLASPDRKITERRFYNDLSKSIRT